MKTLFCCFALLIALVSSFAADSGELDPNLAALKPFFGTWRGEFKGSTADKPLVDISHWERALNGKAIRIVHSINDGAYGGETFVTWDEAKKSLVYHYFTTAGFQTKGTMKVSARKLECHETVSGSGSGAATEVKSTYELKEDGSLESTAQYLKDGQPLSGREVTYKKAQGAKPLFK